MLLDLNARPILPPDRGVLSDIDWSDVARMWDTNQLGQLHDWLNERWSRLIRNSPMGTQDPEAELLQALAFATLALFFTQNRNQEGALLMLDDALLALVKFRPTYMGVRVETLYASLHDLRPLLVGLAPTDECPLCPFVYPKFDYTRSSPCA